MFIAGTDTTSSTVEWAIAKLIRHPQILARAHEELDSVVGPNQLVTELDLPKLTYIHAVGKENFRPHPATPLSLPRISAEGCEINSYHIPKGTTLLINIWAIARDPNQWPEPLAFSPERFFGGGKDRVDMKGNDFELIPFGGRRRICEGMSLGMIGFDWELPNGLKLGNLNMDEAYGLTLQRALPFDGAPAAQTG